jgi:hypothetical protein
VTLVFPTLELQKTRWVQRVVRRPKAETPVIQVTTQTGNKRQWDWKEGSRRNTVGD